MMCTHQVPPGLVKTLYGHRPDIHLHVQTFSLHSLYQQSSLQEDIGPDESALVTSPCLSSIVAEFVNMSFTDDSTTSYPSTSSIEHAFRFCAKLEICSSFLRCS